MRVALLAIMVCATSSCAILVPLYGTPARGEALVPASEVRTGDWIRIRFDAPRDLYATEDTMTYPLPAVTGLRARVDLVRSDTLLLRGLGDFESPVIQPIVPEDALLILVPVRTDVFSETENPNARTALVGLGIAAVVAWVVFLATTFSH